MDAAIKHFKDAGYEDDAYVLTQIRRNPGEHGSKLKDVIQNPSLYETIEPLGYAEALALLLDLGLFVLLLLVQFH